MEYTGYKKLKLANDELAKCYQNSIQELQLDLLDNEYLIALDENNTECYFKYQDNLLIPVKTTVFNNSFSGKLSPRNPEQHCAFDLLKDSSIPLKVIAGPAGSGKTLACVVSTLELVQKGIFSKIVFLRNNIHLKDTEDMGALPGSSYDKALPYIMPFADHCGGIEGLNSLVMSETLEVIPLGFIRGRSLRDSIVYVTEAENLTKEQIQLIMTRIDEGSCLIFDGDIKQRDKNVFERSRGLETLIDRLKGNRNFGYVQLLQSERSEIARLADKLDGDDI